MNAYVNIEPGSGRSGSADAHLTITITFETPTILDAVRFAANVLEGAGTGGDVHVTSSSHSHEPMVREALADQLRHVRGLRVRR